MTFAISNSLPPTEFSLENMSMPSRPENHFVQIMYNTMNDNEVLYARVATSFIVHKALVKIYTE